MGMHFSEGIAKGEKERNLIYLKKTCEGLWSHECLLEFELWGFFFLVISQKKLSLIHI